MSLDASDVSALADTLTKWEYAEYFFAGLVTLACLGEFVAEFTDWFTKGIEERKKRLGKRSTLVLVGALAFELICLVKTNSLSGKLIVSINEQSQGAVDKSKKANEASTPSVIVAANSLGRVLDKLLRIDRKPGEFNTWAKLRDDKKFSPWNWYHPYLQESSRLPQTLYDSRYSDGFHSRRETRQTKT